MSTSSPSELMSVTVNELLSYTLFHYDSAAYADLYSILIDFYEPGEIEAARDILFKLYGKYLGAKPKRVQSANREAHEAMLGDILAAIKKFDEDTNIPCPVFAAVNFNRVPMVSPKSDNITSLSVRFDKVESKIDELRGILATQKPVKVMDQAVSTDSNLCVDKVPAIVSVGTHSSLANSVNDIQYSTVAERLPAGPPLSSMLCHQLERSDGLQHPSHKSQHIDSRSVQILKSDLDDNNHTADGFRFPKYHKSQRKKPVIGTGSATGSLVGCEPSRDIFVYRVKKGTNEDDLQQFLVDAAISVTSISKVSHTDAANDSFKVQIKAKDVKTVMNASFWPSGIGCRRFISPRNPVNHGGS